MIGVTAGNMPPGSLAMNEDLDYSTGMGSFASNCLVGECRVMPMERESGWHPPPIHSSLSPSHSRFLDKLVQGLAAGTFLQPTKFTCKWTLRAFCRENNFKLISEHCKISPGTWG